MNSFRVAVIGYGRWGRLCHAPLIASTPGLKLAGVASGDPEKRSAIERDLGCRAYASLDDVLGDSSVDAVVLATPNDLHAPQAIQALKAGRHVVADKPMCLSLEECDAMTQASQDAGKILTVFQNRRLDGDFLTLQNLITDGKLGDLRWLEMAWQGFGISGGWKVQPERGGGKILDLGAHIIDQMLLLITSKVVGVYCRTHHDFADVAVESEAFLVLEWENGATSIMDASRLAAISKPRFYARGTKATWQKHGLDPQEAALMAGDISLARENPAEHGVLATPVRQEVTPTIPGRWPDYYANFAAALRGEETALVLLEDIRRQIAIFEAAHQSIATGQLIRTSI